MSGQHLLFKPDAALSLREPTATELGRSVLVEGLALLNELGLEAFTFRKLAARAGCTEVSIYKYFANKQRLLQYHFQLYWLWLLQVGAQEVVMAGDARAALRRVVDVLCGLWPGDLPALQVDPASLRRLVIAEGMKSYMHKHVDDDNARLLFKPYKDLSAFVADRLVACRPGLAMPRSFATTLVEMAHSLPFAMEHLPSLTELSDTQDPGALAAHLYERTIVYLEHINPIDP
jgi:AcrR family transcriptional regulator